MTAAYPVQREATVVLRDGSTVSVRPVRREDEAELARFFANLSLESRVFRFFAAVAIDIQGLLGSVTHKAMQLAQIAVLVARGPIPVEVKAEQPVPAKAFATV